MNNQQHVPSRHEPWMDMTDVEQVRQFIVEKNATHSPAEWLTFLKEEWDELNTAMENKDLIEILDAICDLTYELNGLGIILGMDVVGARNEVHRSNMTKDRGEGDHKIRKGDNFSPPDLGKFIGPDHMPPIAAAWFNNDA